MWTDPIVEEVRRVREAHAAKFNYDFDAIYNDIKDQEQKSGRTYVTLVPTRPKHPNGAVASTTGTPTSNP